MAWVVKEPEFGDHIRVNRGLYYHHGIYASKDCVIHFASLTPGHETDPKMAEVSQSSYEVFHKGDPVEVREYSLEELEKKRSAMDIVNYAFTCLGRKGYNLISNNCEHFANECVFGQKSSEQSDQIKNIFNAFF